MLWRESTLTLWKAGITALVVTALGTGCVSGGDDDANVQAQWDVAYVGGTRISCADAGTDWVRLELKSRRNVGAFSYDFPCASGSGLTEDIPPGAYDVTLSLLDAKMRPVSAISGPYEVGRHGRTLLDPIQFQVLAWQVTWSIKRMPEIISNCTEVGMKTVELITQLGSEEQERYQFDCFPGIGLTHAVRSGSYSYQVRGLDAAGQPLMQTAVSATVLDTKLGSIVVPFVFP